MPLALLHSRQRHRRPALSKVPGRHLDAWLPPDVEGVEVPCATRSGLVPVAAPALTRRHVLTAAHAPEQIGEVTEALSDEVDDLANAGGTLQNWELTEIV